MKRRKYNLATLTLALVVMVQAVVPTMALAEVTVRCAGAPAKSTPCMKSVIAVAEPTAAELKCRDMSCCKSVKQLMRACHMAMTDSMMTPDRATPMNGASAPKCLISVRPLSSTQPANVTSVHRWLLVAAPAMAPPVAVDYCLTTSPAASSVRPQSHSLQSHLLFHGHGLRAPPVS